MSILRTVKNASKPDLEKRELSFSRREHDS
jgi:hypothetical protein